MSAWDAAGGSEREGKAFFAQLGGGGATSAVVTIRFQDGIFAEFEAGDDGVASQGYEATYELLGDGSLRLTDTGATDCVGTFTYREQGDRLTLQVVKYVKQCRHDATYNTTLFASFPFTRVT